MNAVTQYDPVTGEIKEDTYDVPTAVLLAKAELDQAVSTAKAYPRSLQRARDNITDLVMLDEETAEECVYALPRGGKPIKGPSVRFAEIVASQYGNCHVGSRVVDVNRFEKYVEAEGVFKDLETGLTRTARIRRRISGKDGRLFNDDMIVVTGNAACSIALREAILKGIPKALWKKAYAAAEEVIAGNVKTLAESREKAVKAFAAWGVTPEQIFASLEVEGLDEITTDHLGTLRAMHKAIRDEEQTVEDYFPAKTDAKDAVGAAKGTAGKLNQIAEEGGKKDPQKDAKAKKARAEADKAALEADDAEAKAKSDESPEKTAQEGEDDDAGGEEAREDDEASESAAEQEDDEDGGAATEEEVARAYERGKTAGKRGAKTTLIPAEYKKDDTLAEAWHDGHRDGTDEREAKE